MPSALASHWTLDPTITFLNHGSFGACPRPVLDEQARLRAHIEAEPVRFFMRELEERLDAARLALAAFVGADPDGLAFVRNATEGVNTVLARLELSPGDALLTTDHAYSACKNALDELAARTGAQVIVAKVPFPLTSSDQIVEAIEAAVTPAVRLALIDHVTSPTGLVLPVPEIVRRLEGRGIECLVDGAHAPGMLELDLAALGATYYTGNCHKWICAPKGAAFLWVRADRRDRVRPLVFSHGARTPRTDRSRFRLEFDWTGTDDPTPALCVPTAIETMAQLGGGWPAVRAHNHALVLEARDLLLAAWGSPPPPAPDALLGSLATIPLPPLRPIPARGGFDPLADALFFDHRIEVPIIPWPTGRAIRVAAQLYNAPADYQRLRDALATYLA